MTRIFFFEELVSLCSSKSASAIGVLFLRDEGEFFNGFEVFIPAQVFFVVRRLQFYLPIHLFFFIRAHYSLFPRGRRRHHRTGRSFFLALIFRTVVGSNELFVRITSDHIIFNRLGRSYRFCSHDFHSASEDFGVYFLMWFDCNCWRVKRLKKIKKRREFFRLFQPGNEAGVQSFSTGTPKWRPW